MATRRRARLRARVSYWIIWKWKYSSLLCSGWHAWVTLNRIIFRGKIHDKCHTLVTVTRHGTRHISIYTITSNWRLKIRHWWLYPHKHNIAINFLLLLASYFQWQDTAAWADHWSLGGTRHLLPSTWDRGPDQCDQAQLCLAGDLGILLRHLNTQLRARTDGAWSSVTLQLKSEDLSLSSHHVL